MPSAPSRPPFKHNEAFSLQIATADQAETDRYWNAIVGHGGQENVCGWCKDKCGLSWQITPVALLTVVTDPDRAMARRAFGAMMPMNQDRHRGERSGTTRLKPQLGYACKPMVATLRDLASLPWVSNINSPQA